MLVCLLVCVCVCVCVWCVSLTLKCGVYGLISQGSLCLCVREFGENLLSATGPMRTPNVYVCVCVCVSACICLCVVVCVREGLY